MLSLCPLACAPCLEITVGLDLNSFTVIFYDQFMFYSRCVVSCGVATISRLLKMTGLFCRISSLLSLLFAQEPYERDCILQKRRMIWRSLLIVATPCHDPQSRDYEEYHSKWLCMTRSTVIFFSQFMLYSQYVFYGQCVLYCHEPQSRDYKEYHSKWLCKSTVKLKRRVLSFWPSTMATDCGSVSCHGARSKWKYPPFRLDCR